MSSSSSRRRSSGNVVVPDNLAAQKVDGVRRAIAAVGQAVLPFEPPLGVCTHSAGSSALACWEGNGAQIYNDLRPHGTVSLAPLGFDLVLGCDLPQRIRDFSDCCTWHGVLAGGHELFDAHVAGVERP
jgi:hypothetical protein